MPTLYWCEFWYVCVLDINLICCHCPEALKEKNCLKTATIHSNIKINAAPCSVTRSRYSIAINVPPSNRKCLINWLFYWNCHVLCLFSSNAAFVKYGPSFMKHRPPVRLEPLMIAYNLGIAGLNAYISYNVNSAHCSLESIFRGHSTLSYFLTLLGFWRRHKTGIQLRLSGSGVFQPRRRAPGTTSIHCIIPANFPNIFPNILQNY